MSFEATLSLLANSSPTKKTTYKVGIRLLESVLMLMQNIVSICDEKDIDLSDFQLLKLDMTTKDQLDLLQLCKLTY